jgi:hypothetical protein
MGHMDMIMDENNFRVWDGEVIGCKCSCSKVAIMVKGVK